MIIQSNPVLTGPIGKGSPGILTPARPDLTTLKPNVTYEDRGNAETVYPDKVYRSGSMTQTPNPLYIKSLLVHRGPFQSVTVVTRSGTSLPQFNGDWLLGVTSTGGKTLYDVKTGLANYFVTLEYASLGLAKNQGKTVTDGIVGAVAGPIGSGIVATSPNLPGWFNDAKTWAKTILPYIIAAILIILGVLVIGYGGETDALLQTVKTVSGVSK